MILSSKSLIIETLKIRKNILQAKLLYRSKHESVSTVLDSGNINEIEAKAEVNSISNKRLLFRGNNGPAKGKYNAILPPPNITGDLHLGHALMATLHDVVARWKYINGYDVQFIPGTDHAGIATQIVVEKYLHKTKGLNRHEIGKEAFLGEVHKWKELKGDSIREELTKLGNIFNWEHEYFTMDEAQSHAVVEAFIRLFNQKLLYRKSTLVNWCCALESTIADIEIENIEINGPTKLKVPGYSDLVTFGEIYDVAYKYCSSDEHEIIVSTTRPETILGDVAIAVNPNDSRFLHLQNDGIQLNHPFRRKPIPLIFDDNVDPTFGTGAVKITPAHSKDDYEIAEKHCLERIEVIDEKGNIHSNFEYFQDMPRFRARTEILNKLSDLGLLRETRSHKLFLPICSRSRDIIEYLLKPQWFINCERMTQQATDYLSNGSLVLDPPKFEKDWNNWLKDHRDWCISRQVWWGHRIPAYECKVADRVEWVAAHNYQEAGRKASEIFQMPVDKITLRQDEDVLDTWFSSGILPFSALGWPTQSNISANYPLDILITGHDILFFWVIRMVLLGSELTSQVPFRKVFLHGIIHDSKGQKMSKSRGNVISPDQIRAGASLQSLCADVRALHSDGVLTKKEMDRSISEKQKEFPKGIPVCGTDALRFTLCSYNVTDHYINFEINVCNSNRLFLRKIWNAARFFLHNCNQTGVNCYDEPQLKNETLREIDRWILSRLAKTMIAYRNAMEDFRFHDATHALRSFFYENLCDIYLEAIKIHLQTKIEPFASAHLNVLKVCLFFGLRYLGVFTPFLSNELLKYLPPDIEFSEAEWLNESLEQDVDQILNICAMVRQLSRDSGIALKHEPKLYLFAADTKTMENAEKFKEIVSKLTFSSETIVEPMENYEKYDSLTVQSIVDHLCCFGIIVSKPFEISADTRNVNMKKLKKLEDNLQLLLDIVNKDRYKQRASDSVKQENSLKIEKFKFEIEKLRKLL